MTFKELGLGEGLMEALGYMGFENATPIQAAAIPLILQKKDLLACAQTGTGKTAAFILPVLEHIATYPRDETACLVLAPTRELAVQIEHQIQAFAYFADISSRAVYGGGDGQEFEEQKKALINGANIIVATPGKLISHLNMGYVKFANIRHFILDEADRMLDMGFVDDIEKIASFLPKKKQTLLFSATFPPKIKALGKKLLNDPEEISLAVSKPAAGVLQVAYCLGEDQKIELISRLIADKPQYKSIIIFSSTKKKVGQIVRGIQKTDRSVQAVSSDLEQSERELAVRKFKSKETRIIVATDVLSRGIDIKDINLVINYDVPGDAADYVHRVGRTARADTTGVAITLITEDDMSKFGKIERLIESEVMKAPLFPDMKPGPKYDPSRRPSKRRSFGKKGGNSRHWKKRK